MHWGTVEGCCGPGGRFDARSARLCLLLQCTIVRRRRGGWSRIRQHETTIHAEGKAGFYSRLLSWRSVDGGKVKSQA